MPGPSNPDRIFSAQVGLERALAAVAAAQGKLHAVRAFNAAARNRAEVCRAEAWRSAAFCRKLQMPGDQAPLRPAA